MKEDTCRQCGKQLINDGSELMSMERSKKCSRHQDDVEKRMGGYYRRLIRIEGILGSSKILSFLGMPSTGSIPLIGRILPALT